MSYVLAFYALLVLLKSFLVVFARVLYRDHTIGVHGSGVSPFGSVSADSNQYEISAGGGPGFFSKLDAIGNNVVDRKRIPFWYKIPIARIFNRAFVLCYIDPKEYEKPCFLKVNSPGKIVVWTLKPDEEVIFNVSDFVGISDNVALKSKISLNIASLVFGRIIYHYALGPGVLLLRTRDEALVGWKGPATGALNIAGLVAWNARNEFNIVAWPSIAGHKSALPRRTGTGRRNDPIGG